MLSPQLIEMLLGVFVILCAMLFAFKIFENKRSSFLDLNEISANFIMSPNSFYVKFLVMLSLTKRCCKTYRVV